MGTVKIRYIGPLTEGVWTADSEHGAHDFAPGEFVDVPIALAVELMGQLEPVPPGEPVKDPETGQYVTELAPVWELGPGESLPNEDAAAPTKPARAAGARKGARR